MRLVACPRIVISLVICALCACTEQKSVAPNEPGEQKAEYQNQTELSQAQQPQAQQSPTVPSPAEEPLPAQPDSSPALSPAGPAADSEFNDALTLSKIHWYEGQVQAAFDEAKQANKPLFLYWGAVWCPPCEEIKQTVFKSLDFITQSRLFIPVYLDGDSQRAQTWGETFAVKGYPTMIVFNPQGEEITRIPGGIDISQYNQVLARSLEAMRPTSELLTLALTRGTSRLTAQDFSQIAYYSWWQKNLPENILVSASTLSKLAHLAEEKGNRLAADRLQLQALILGYENEQNLSPEDAQNVHKYLSVLLADRHRVIANLDLLIFWSEEILSVIAEPGEERAQLVMRWVAGMKAVRYDQRLSHPEQIGTWYPELYFYWMDNPEATSLETADLQDLLQHINRLDKSTQGSARQAYVNRAYQVLLAARLPAQAEYMLQQEIKNSHQPYYFMSSLAQLARDQGNSDLAIHWLQKAYEAAHGHATRFQWGVEYITGVLTMQPEQTRVIDQGIDSLLATMEQPQDVFAGRNFRRLNTLLAAIEQWPSREASTAVMAFYDSLRRACKASRRDSIARQNCRTLDVITNS